ncbi:hypothetical protein LSH36_119g07020 [Paralvinella palmiformis]|uniref:SOCS box domain-containing protein n=1 Tax=Paralvinella palmiformis TaxID=53620 RepID=A0AAD9JYY1_9ANNE|nr:hypothetical protein LSH36_119g07020 [Paralvinella palmiformis]
MNPTFEVLHFKTVLDKRAIELSPPELELFTAIRCEDIEVLQNTLKTQSVKLNIRDDTGHTFLGVAASTGFLDGVRTLLEAGCNVNGVDFYGQTPLQYAAGSGHLEIVKLLIEHGKYTLINGISVLHCAVGNNHREIVEMLLKARARINVCGVKSGRTPLFVAAEVGDLQILNMLISAGARVNIPNDYGMTPLCAVCLQNNSQVAFRLLEAGAGLKVNLADNRGSIPLHYAARFGNTDVMEALIEKGSELNVINDHFESPLHLAVRNCHMKAVEVLIDHGCDVNACDSRGLVTALHTAVNSCTDEGVFSDILSTLIKGGCVLDSCAFVSMETPLFRALNLEKVHFAIILLQHGSDPNTECPFDQTILQKACEKKWKNLIDLLLHCRLKWTHESWLDTDIHMSGINPKLLKGYARNVPAALLSDADLYFRILEARCNPPRLIDMCRWSIRKLLGNKLCLKLSQTQLPIRLKDFCMLRIL